MALVDRYVSSLAGGGGDGTEGDPWTLAEGTSTGPSAGDLVNVKGDGSYAAQIVWSADGTAADPIHYRAYSATPGDGGRATITLNNEITADHLIVEGLDYVDPGAATICVKLDGNHNTFKDCTITVSGASCQKGLVIDNGAVAIDCEIDMSASGHANPYCVEVQNGAAQGCKVIEATSGNGHGIVGLGSAFKVVAGNAIVGNGNTSGIWMDTSAGYIVYGNSVYNSVALIKVRAATAATAATQQVIGNIGYNCNYGVAELSGVVTAGVAFAYNAIGGASIARYSGFGDTPTFYDTILTADPFVDAANGDLRLNNAAGGGALARRAGVRVPALLV